MSNSSFAFWNFLDFLEGRDIFDPQLVESVVVEPMGTEGQLYFKNSFGNSRSFEFS